MAVRKTKQNKSQGRRRTPRFLAPASKRMELTLMEIKREVHSDCYTSGGSGATWAEV